MKLVHVFLGLSIILPIQLFGCGQDSSLEPISPPAANIAFVSNRDGTNDVFVMDKNGGNIHNVTNHHGYESDPRWAPDGSRIAYVSTYDFMEYIYVVDIETRDPVKVADPGGLIENYSWAHSGNAIAFISKTDDENYELYTVNSDGSNPVKIFSTDVRIYTVLWTAGDSRLIYETSNRLVSIETDGSNEIVLIDETINTAGCSLSKDGTKIVFSIFHGFGMINIDGSGLQLYELNEGCNNVSLSPDGTKVAFSNTNYIFIVNSDGTDKRKVFSALGKSTKPCWSSDGSQIVFQVRIKKPTLISFDVVSAYIHEDGYINLTDNELENSVEPDWNPVH